MILLKNPLPFLLFTLLTSFSFCNGVLQADKTQTQNFKSEINPSGEKLKDRLIVPEGYYRVPAPEDSFDSYLLNLPVKPDNSKVILHNGSFKANQSVHAAVINLPIGKQNLHQCADAILRLRSEYLYSAGRKKDIQFHLTNRFLFDYSRYSRGYRLKVSGNRTEWQKKSGSNDSLQTLESYLTTLYMYAGTISIAWDSEQAELSQLKRGDFFLQSGSPGHAVIVVDVIRKSKDDSFLFVLAQSYMPAQEIHVLKNTEKTIYYDPEDILRTGILRTPEWDFPAGSLRRFKK